MDTTMKKLPPKPIFTNIIADKTGIFVGILRGLILFAEADSFKRLI